MPIEIRLLGALEVITPTGSLTAADFVTKKAKQVFEVLALARGRTVSKDTLVDTLWRRRQPQNPAATVEVAVSLLRRTLATVTDQQVIVTEPGGYRIDTSVAAIDVMQFSDLVSRAGALSDFDRLPLLVEAAGLIRGPLAEDEANAEWVEADREGIHRRLEAARLEIARLSVASGNAALAHEMAEAAWLASDFVLEQAYALGVAALLQLGRRDEADRLLRTVQSRLATEEGRAPADATLALQSLVRASPPRPPSQRSLVVDPSFAVAPEVLPFLGRSDVLASIDAAIARRLRDGESASGTGAVLVSGPVGIGRSRLLAEAVARQAEQPWTTHSLRGEPNDSGHEMLLVGRLIRSIASAAKLRKQVEVEPSVSAMFARIAGLLDRLGPTVIVVDDFHLADAASQAVLGALVAPGGASRLCLLAGWRGSTDDHVVAPLGSGLVLTLSALQAADLEPLTIPTAWMETGGHPATLAACCAAGRNGGRLDGAMLTEVLARVDALGDMARFVLGAAAALAAPFSAREVALRVGLGVDATVEELGRAVREGLLRRLPTDDLEFVGDVLRRALAGATGDVIR